MGRRRRSPQEKKLLSYRRDRRNAYGGNAKSSRRNIPLSKRLPHRANRNAVQRILRAAAGRVDVDGPDPAGPAAAHPASIGARRPAIAWPGSPLRHVEQPMVSVSVETPEQTERRLRQVIGAAEFVVLDGVWCFEESPADRPPALTADTLAVVRDEDSWSRLVPATGSSGAAERFGVFSFHFPKNLDNSGFVGWLASVLKARLGTGVFVVCGSNRHRGGVYDYWGCPADLIDEAVAVVEELRTA